MAVSVKFYKPGQGMLTRWVAFGLLALLVVFGCNSLYHFVAGRSDWWAMRLFTLPVVDIGVTRGHLITTGIAAVFCFLIYVLAVNQPKAAEFLIETEGELKKVNWPPRHEFLGSSFIVLLSVVFISLYLMVVDLVLTYTVNQLILR